MFAGPDADEVLRSPKIFGIFRIFGISKSVSKDFSLYDGRLTEDLAPSG